MQNEIFIELLQHANVKINKIISPKNFCSKVFCQNDDEFVFLVQGEATLQIGATIQHLKKEESLFIPSGVPHQILRTSAQEETIWLAVHITN